MEYLVIFGLIVMGIISALGWMLIFEKEIGRWIGAIFLAVDGVITIYKLVH